MRYLLTLFLLLSPLFAAETFIEADHADYNGNEVTLTGNVVIENEMGRALADKGILYRDADQRGFEAKEITLIGNVQLINREADQYALADEVVYFPATEEVIFRCLNEKKVLFYDKSKEMQLSAHTVKARRHGENGKESIQGFGDVRMVFGDEELAKFKKKFRLDGHDS